DAQIQRRRWIRTDMAISWKQLTRISGAIPADGAEPSTMQKARPDCNPAPVAARTSASMAGSHHGKRQAGVDRTGMASTGGYSHACRVPTNRDHRNIEARHLERQLPEGPPGPPSRLAARESRGHRLPAGDQAAG